MSRPLKFANPVELQKSIDEYFIKCEADGKAISITGLAIHLDTFRQTLCNYELKDEFVDTIKKAKQRVENFYEERLTLPNVAGAVFALKNFDWTDKSDLNLGGQKDNPIVTALPAEDKAALNHYFKTRGTTNDGLTE